MFANKNLQQLWLMSALAVFVAGAGQHQLLAVEPNLPTMEVAQAVMVTVELDFGSRVQSIGDALREIDRQGLK